MKKESLIFILFLLVPNLLSGQNNGKWLVEPTYNRIRFVDQEADLIPVADDYRKWGFIDTQGTVVIPFKFDIAYAFSDGLAAVKIEGKYGYIDKIGEIKIQPQFYTAGTFRNGHAIVGEKDGNYLINEQGVTVSAKYVDMGRLTNNYIAGKKGHAYDIIDLSGKVVKARFCTDFFHFSEGMAGVKINGKWGFVDENLKIIIKPQFTEKLVYAFHDGLARFKKGGKVGVIDKTGKVVLPATYDNLYEFNDGLAAFSKNGKWGYINEKGDVVIKAKYMGARNFRHKFAVLEVDVFSKSLMDKTGKIILEGFSDIHIISARLLALKTKYGWGLFELN